MIEHECTLDSLIETRGVIGVYEVDTDGFLLGAIDSGKKDKDAIAAVSAVTHISSERIGDVLRLGNLAWILLEFTQGKLIISRHGGKIWAIVASNHVLLGEVLAKLDVVPKSMTSGDYV